MKPIYRFITGILVCLGLAAGAYFWATGMLDSLYAFRSPLKDRPPAPGERVGSPATRRVVFVLVDALRYDTASDAAVMPTLAKLRQSGAAAKMRSRTPSFSQPGYTTLLTGAWPDVNDGPAMNLDYAGIPTWTQDNLFSAARRAGLKTAVSGFYWFEKLVPQEAVTAHFYTPGEDAAADQAVIDAALPWLDDPQAFQFILIHIDQVDYAGHHEGGPRSANWTAAAKRTDGMIAQVAQKLDLSQDTLLVASDHGQIDRGGHGGQEAINLVEPFVLTGAGVKPGDYGDIQMVDLAPTVAALLGLNLPASGQGQAQADMLALPTDTAARLPFLQVTQQQQMVIDYAAAIQQPVRKPAESSAASWQSALEAAQTARLSRERLLRGGLALVVMAVMAWLVTRLTGRRILRLAVSALVFLLVFNLRYAVLDGLSYSFSTVPSASEMITYCGVTTAAALLIGWLLYAWMGGLFRADPTKFAGETLTLALFILGVLALPALAHFVLNGLSVTWILPEPISFFLGLLSLIQALFVAVLGLVLSGIAALVGWVVNSRQRSSVPTPAR